MSRVAQEQEQKKEKAELYYGDELCQEKTKLLLKEVGMPNGLLPLEDILECGYVEETGYVWLKQRKKKEHNFHKIGKLVSYATEVTAYVEKNKIKKLTGVKAKELLVWITICEITADEPPADKVSFKSTTGLFRTFPASAFHVDEVPTNKSNAGVNVPAPTVEEKKLIAPGEADKKNIIAPVEEKKNPLTEEVKKNEAVEVKKDEPIKEDKKNAAIEKRVDQMRV